MFLIKHILLANSGCWRKADEYEKQIYPGSPKSYLLFILIYLIFHKLLTAIFPTYVKGYFNYSYMHIPLCTKKSLSLFFPVCHLSYGSAYLRSSASFLHPGVKEDS